MLIKKKQTFWLENVSFDLIICTLHLLSKFICFSQTTNLSGIDGDMQKHYRHKRWKFKRINKVISLFKLFIDHWI